MTFTHLNKDWNAEPNAPEVILNVDDNTVVLEFYLNNSLFDNIGDSDRGKLTFLNCHKYSFNTMNEEGYYLGQYRYHHKELPWGEFYCLNTECQTDFPEEYQVLNAHFSTSKQNHYIYFFKDNTFECVADGYKFEHIRKNNL